MKKITLILIVSFMAISKLSAQWDSTKAAAVATAEAFKIQYVFEGVVFNIQLYAGDTSGNRLTASDMVMGPYGVRTYRKLSNGENPICYSIASIRICQMYKGTLTSDTVKVITAHRNTKYVIKVLGPDTTIGYNLVEDGSQLSFKQGMEGFKAVFFAYNHTYLGVSSAIKILSPVGTIDFHTTRWNPDSGDPSDRIMAGSTGALFYAHASFYSRQELYDALEDIPILGLNVDLPNICEPSFVAAEKKSSNTNENPTQEKLKSDYQENLKNYNIWLKKANNQIESAKHRNWGLKRSNNLLTMEMVKPRITGAGSIDTWLEFDIMVSSNVSMLYFDNCLLLIHYDNSITNKAFGSNVKMNGNIEIQRGAAFNNSSYMDPQAAAVDRDDHTVSIPVSAISNPTSRTLLTSTPQKLIQVRFRIVKRNQSADIYFDDTAFTHYFSFYTIGTNDSTKFAIGYDATFLSGGNNDKTCIPIISNFNNNVHGGTGEILTIEGKYFGDSLGKDIRSAIFKNANRGDEYPTNGLFRNGVDNKDIVYWNHDTIKIRMPSIIDSISSNSSNPDWWAVPGTGKFMVKNRYAEVKESTGTLTIPYSIAQYIDKNNIVYTKSVPKLAGMNPDYGYTIHVTSRFNSKYPGGKAVIRKAMRDWTCETGIRWTLGSDTSLGIKFDDSVCIIDIAPNLYLEGKIAQTTRSIDACPIGSPYPQFLKSFDIEIASDNNTTWEFDTMGSVATGDNDFYEVITHELGHGHSLKHINNETDVMYWFKSPLGISFSNRIHLSNSPNAADAGHYVTDNLISALSGCSNAHSLVTCPNLSTKSVQNNQSNLIVFPNPISNGYLTIEIDQYLPDDTYFLIFDNMGRMVNRIELSSMNEREYKIPVDNLANGIYLLQIVSGDVQHAVKFIKQ